MFTSIEVIPTLELEARRERFRSILRKRYPEMSGIMVFSRSNIYYYTGTFAVGMLWLPLEGEPILAVRKGIERAALEAPATKTLTYKSYSQVAALMAEAGSPIKANFGVEQSGLSWALGSNFSKNFGSLGFVPADDVLTRTRSVKTAWELVKVREAGARHYKATAQLLPELMHYGMSGFDISRILWGIFAELGSTGATRMTELGQEVMLGHIAVNENTAYPSYYNGPLGVKGIHPTASFMGCASEIWAKDGFVAVDTGFVWEGYNSDKTLLYFAGKEKDIPSWARRAQDCCLDIQTRISQKLCTGAIPSELYRESLELAKKAGYAEGYMGYAGSQVPFVGHGIGLQVDEWPVLANRFDEPLEENTVMAIEPKITLPGHGMVGVENTFIVKAKGGECINAGASDLSIAPGDFVCVDK